MNYQRLHDSIIEHARQHPFDGYTESHHIVPKCMGGGNEKTNRVRLSARQHFVVHRLLCKIHPNHIGLRFALNMMFGDIKSHARKNDPEWASSVTKSHTYQKHREQFSSMLKGRKLSTETKLLISTKVKGLKRTPEQIIAMSNRRIGIPHSKVTTDKLSKKWSITTPANETFTIINLRQFCRDNNLDQGAMSSVAAGKRTHHKQFKIVGS